MIQLANNILIVLIVPLIPLILVKGIRLDRVLFALYLLGLSASSYLRPSPSIRNGSTCSFF